MRTPYHITLLQTEDSIDVATTHWDGRTFGHACYVDAVASLARQLVQAGAPDGPWELMAPSSKPRFYGLSLHLLAKGAAHQR